MTNIITLILLLFLVDLFCQKVLAGEATVISNNKIQATTHYKSSSEDDYTCRKSSTFVWCIPQTYSNRKEPWRYRELLNGTLPWTYHFDFHIFDVKEVNDKMQTVRISMYFSIKWLEPRIMINETSADWSDITYGQPDSIEIAPEFIKTLWNPDLELYGMEEFRSQSILKDMSSLKIMKNRHVQYMLRVDISISCQMKFDTFPLDRQICPFRIGSYSSTIETVNCTEKYKYDNGRQRSLQYSIEIDSLPETSREFKYESKRYAICGFKILLNRTRGQTFFQVYLTSIIFVVVSWVSFIIKPEVVPGRMALLVTTLLVLINIFNGVKANAPTSTSLNAVDLYLVVCIGLVFLALVEFAIVLFRDRCNLPLTLNKPNLTKSSLPNQAKDAPTKTSLAWPEENLSMNKYDFASLFVFPTFFIAFNVIYCVIHF